MVNLAARLMAAAAEDEVLVDHATMDATAALINYEVRLAWAPTLHPILPLAILALSIRPLLSVLQYLFTRA